MHECVPAGMFDVLYQRPQIHETRRKNNSGVQVYSKYIIKQVPTALFGRGYESKLYMRGVRNIISPRDIRIVERSALFLFSSYLI